MNIIEVSREWDNEQIQLLQSIYPTLKFKKWKIIVEQFHQKGFTRTERELKLKWKYINDTNNDHKKWTYQQLKILYTSVYYQGSNWSTIRKRLKGRTCMKLKNTFYNSMRKFLKNFYDDIYQNQNSYNNKNLQILPSISLKIFCGQQEFQSINNSILQIFGQFQYYFTHANFYKFKMNQIQLYQSLKALIKENIDKIFIIKDKQQKKQSYQQQSFIEFGKISQIVNLTKTKDQNKLKDINFQYSHKHASYRDIPSLIVINQQNIQQQQFYGQQWRVQQNLNDNNEYQNVFNNMQLYNYQPNEYIWYYLWNGIPNSMYTYNSE